MFKVIVAGSRNFYDYTLLCQRLDKILSNVKEEIEIVSGTADGADQLGERYAAERGYKLKRFPANWAKHGYSAGPIRNEEMAKYAAPDGGCVIFWDGVSRGSKNMKATAERYKLKLRVVMF